MKYLLALGVALFALPLAAADQDYRVYFGGTDVGHLEVRSEDDALAVDYDYKQNGRGPTIKERLVLDDRGYPTDWAITGSTTFGSPVDEYFKATDGVAQWRDTTGPGDAEIDGEPLFYVDQSASPYSLGLLAKALLAEEDGSMPVYPGGEARITRRDVMTVAGTAGATSITFYEITGLAYNPQLVILDDKGEFFGIASPRFSVIRDGYAEVEAQLRQTAERLSTNRFVDIQTAAARYFDSPVRVRNVRVFDPITLALTEPKDVVVYGKRIASVQPVNSPVSEGEVSIDGAGGSLVPGMYEMHGHLGQENALLNIAAGVTSVRDMGNENEVLEDLIERINEGVIAGPRITRSCFIEGQSDFSSATGETVSTLEEGLAQVRWCAARDFHQVKLYNSMKPEWADAMVAEAHRLGLRVAGHVPAFSSADAMIEAGFDEMTHANQLMLGWVLNPDEDTRTLFRFTAMRRFPEMTLDDPKVEHTIAAMKARGVAHDPTIAIHELGLTAINGEPAPTMAAVIDHLPPNVQRGWKQELFGTESQAERDEYIAAYEFIVSVLARLNDEGILLVPGTDLGGSFAYHRELELFEQIGLSPAQVLRRASYDMAAYLDQDEDLGSIEKGKYADFFLVPGDPTADLGELHRIQMVVSDGVVYFPSEIYPHFGIKPFVEAPKMVVPE